MYEYGYEQDKLCEKRWNNKEMLLNINMQSECLQKGRGLFLATSACDFNKIMYFERVNFKHIYITMSVPEH